MRQYKYLQFCIALIFISTMFSCQKDWLNPAPENTLISTDSTFNDPANAELFVNACYAKLIDWEVSVFSWTGVSSISSDDADKGSDPGDLGADKDQFDNLTYSPTSLSVSEVWNGYFAGVGRCNQALANIPKFATLDANKAKVLTGEAKFLRAFYYFNLVRVFGGVPKIDRVFTAEEQDNLSTSYIRASEEEIYALIVADLTDAINSLPDKGSAQIGRANKGAAQGYLAKVYMYQKNWAKCAELTNTLISSGTYSLNPDYKTVWRQSSENNSESLFEIQGQNGDDGWGIGGYFTHQGARGTVTDGYGGWGFNTPTKDLEDAFESGDVRKNTTIYRPGETLWDGAKVETDATNERYNYKAYVSKNEETNYDDWSSGKNIRVLRYAEVLLINAEANNELGKVGEATTSLNLVRNRAGLANSSASSQAALRDAIWQERRVELAMEHDRFFDLVRQGRAGQVMRAHGKPFVDGKHERFPIPLSQILISQGKLTQNPGY